MKSREIIVKWGFKYKMKWNQLKHFFNRIYIITNERKSKQAHNVLHIMNYYPLDKRINNKLGIATKIKVLKYQKPGSFGV